MYKEKIIDAAPGYAIFFDNVRVDKFVTNFSSTLHSDGSMASANISMIYIKDLYRIHNKNSSGEVTSIEDGIEDNTNVKIFVKNIFNNQYIQVFDGVIKSRHIQKTPRGRTMSFSAVDYLLWLNKTIVPVTVPFLTEIGSGESLRWKAQGIDIKNVDKVLPVAEYSFRGKTLDEFIGKMRSLVLRLNKIFSDENSVSYWDNADGRISIMGDISENLISRKIVDFVITSSATVVHSLYVGINDIARKLMFEFFQDRDGVIRIKPPFWNQKVLRDHVIDPMMIMSSNNNANWSNRVTRISITGGIEEYQESFSDYMKDVVTPAGAYIGGSGLWSDYLSKDSGVQNVQILGYTSENKLDTYLDGIRVSGQYLEDRGDHYHQGIDYALSKGSPIYNIGLGGTAFKRVDSKGIDRGYGLYVLVVIEEGIFSGCEVIYAHLEKSDISSSGTKVKAGDLLGYCGNTGASTGPHLHFEIRATEKHKSRDPRAKPKDPTRKTTMDPAIYRQLVTGKGVSVQTYGSEDLLSPSDEEKKYGMSLQDIYQPLIKFSGKGESERDTYGRDALKKYAEFRYDLANSIVETASVQVIGMPWLRPGFNVWLDPLVTDQVYYINSISHVGSADAGVYTTLNLTMGRNRIKFADGSSSFGAMKSESDNAFINRMNQTVSDFGTTIESSGGFHSIRKNCEKFHSNEDQYINKSDAIQYLKSLYGVTNADRKINTVGDFKAKPSSESVSDSDFKFHYESWPVGANMFVLTKSIYVVELKEALSLQGFRVADYVPGSFDVGYSQDAEVFDVAVWTSLKEYQSSKGLKPNGELTQETINKLKLDETINIISRKTDVNVYGGKNLSGALFTGGYTIRSIQSILNATYANAPSIVLKRANRLKNLVNSAESYIKQSYSTENF